VTAELNFKERGRRRGKRRGKRRGGGEEGGGEEGDLQGPSQLLKSLWSAKYDVGCWRAFLYSMREVV